MATRRQDKRATQPWLAALKRVLDLGFGVWGLGFRVQGLGFRAKRGPIWGFPKCSGALLGVLIVRGSPAIWGTLFGVPSFRKPPISLNPKP